MAYGVNRYGQQSRAHFQLAGGSTIKFRHPYLTGQIDGTPLDEIDISACLKLEGRYFEATPTQDSARQIVLIDGSTATICNRLLNGIITLPVIQTTGFVGTGDFIAACQLIKSVGDTVGGALYKIDHIGGKSKIRLYYGVTVKSCPDDISEGTDVPVYPIQLYYAGWIEAQGSSTDVATKKIWAVGNATGLEGVYTPYKLQNGGTEAAALASTNSSLVGADKVADDVVVANNIANRAKDENISSYTSFKGNASS